MSSEPCPTAFLRRFLTTAMGGLLIIATFNLVVDPNCRFGLNRLGVYTSATREYKLRQAGRVPHNALLVGNSRIAQIPSASLPGWQFFNGGMEGASLEEVRLFLERNLRTNELVVLNLDHYILGFESDLEPAAAFVPLNVQLVGKYLLSLKSIEYSFRTLAKSLAKKPPVIAPDGTNESVDWIRERDLDDPAWFQREVATQSRHVREFEFKPKRLSELQAIKDLVQKRQGRLVVFFSPVHEDLLPFLESEPAATQWKNAVRAVQSMFPGTVDLTRSTYSSRSNFYRTDPVHFLPRAGTDLLNKAVLPSAK